MSGILAYTSFFAAGLLGLGGVRVPYTLIQPENSVAEQMAGSFQLAGAAYGIQKMGAKAYGLWASPRGLLDGTNPHLTITGSDSDTNYSSATGYGPFQPKLNPDGQQSTISAIVWPTVLCMAFLLVLGILLKIGHWVYILVTDLEKGFKHWRFTVKNATLDNYSRQRKIQETLDKHGRQLSNIYVFSSVIAMGVEQIQQNIDLIKLDMADKAYKLGRLQYSANCAEDELKYLRAAVDKLTNPAGDQDSQPMEPLAPRPEVREEQTDAPVVASEEVIPDPQTSTEDSANEQVEQSEISTKESSSADQSPSSSEGMYDSARSSQSSPQSQPEEANVEANVEDDPVVASEEVIPNPQASTDDSANEQEEQPEISTKEPSSADQSPTSSEGIYDSAHSSQSSPQFQPKEANVENPESQDAPRNPDDQPQESLD